MSAEQRITECYRFIIDAVEASLYQRPEAPGLTPDEIKILAGLADYKAGTIHDALQRLGRNAHVAMTDGRWYFRLENGGLLPFANFAHGGFEPEYRNFKALDSMVAHLHELAEDRGKDHATATRDDLLNLGFKNKIPRRHMLVAFEVLRLGGFLVADKQDQTKWRIGPPYLAWALPSVSLGHHKVTRPGVQRAYELVAQMLETSSAPPVQPAIVPPAAAVLTNASVEEHVSNKQVFIVHGHDEPAKDSIEAFILRLGLEPIILHRRPNQGRTIIEKLEQEAAPVGFAVVLLTPDDEGRKKGTPTLHDRARQNVILELGLFVGLLKRARVCALYKPGVEVPSDFSGVLYVEMDAAGNWQRQLANELLAAKMPFDPARALA